ncbi:MAG: response regulator [Candidatus Omnitrophota bacterium]
MKGSILIIDDEVIITKSLQKLLQKKEYDVTVAHNGTEALAQVKEKDFNLIVCDVRIPEMDGIEIIKGIRESLKQQNKPAVPEVLITGYADEEKYKNAINLKVADYIYKPFDTSEFLEIVQKHVK